MLASGGDDEAEALVNGKGTNLRAVSLAGLPLEVTVRLVVGGAAALLRERLRPAHEVRLAIQGEDGVGLAAVPVAPPHPPPGTVRCGLHNALHDIT